MELERPHTREINSPYANTGIKVEPTRPTRGEKNVTRSGEGDGISTGKIERSGN